MTNRTLEELIRYDQTVSEEDSFELDDEVTYLAQRIGWHQVFNDAVEVLLNCDKKDVWYTSASVIAWAIQDEEAIPFSWQKVVGLLYGCLTHHPQLGVNGVADGENLVWSIAHELKGIGYLSEWEPLNDPEIVSELNRLEWKNA